MHQNKMASLAVQRRLEEALRELGVEFEDHEKEMFVPWTPHLYGREVTPTYVDDGYTYERYSSVYQCHGHTPIESSVEWVYRKIKESLGGRDGVKMFTFTVHPEMLPDRVVGRVLWTLAIPPS